MAQEYTVSEVIRSSPAQYEKERVTFKTQETGERSLSGFAFPGTIAPGKKVYGDIQEKTVEGKTYYNFQFAKRGGAEGGGTTTSLAEVKNAIVLKVIPLLEQIWEKISNGIDTNNY